MAKDVTRIGVIVITIIFVSFCFFNVKHKNIDLKILSRENSYASEYALKHNINFKKIYDSNIKEYMREAEVLKYKEKNDNYIVSNYDGIDDTLVIPDTYNNKKVTEIDINFLKENKTIKKIVIGENIEKLDDYILNNYEVLCYSNDYCADIEKDNVKTIDEKVLVNQSFPYEYTIKDNTVILEEYKAKDKSLVIPYKYNGYEVVKINFDLSEFEEVFVPKTVTSLKVNVVLNNDKVICCGFGLISLLLLLGLIHFIKKDNKYVANRFIAILVCWVCQLLLIYYYINSRLEFKYFILMFVSVGFIDILFSFIFSKIENRSEKFDNKIKDVTNFKNELLVILNTKDNDFLAPLVDKVTFMDPVSSETVKDLEVKIKNNINNIDSNTSKEEIETIIKYIEERNMIIKNNK